MPGFTSLQALFIHSQSILALPVALGRLTRLRTLDCTGCTSLSELPESLGGLSNLATLRLDACLQVRQLPESLSELCSLQELTLGACATLQVIDLTALAKKMSKGSGSQEACCSIKLSFTAHRYWLLTAALRRAWHQQVPAIKSLRKSVAARSFQQDGTVHQRLVLDGCADGINLQVCHLMGMTSIE